MEEQSSMEGLEISVSPMIEEQLYDGTEKLETMDNDAAYSSDMTFGSGFQQEADPIQQAPVKPKSILKNKSGEQHWKKKSNDNKEKVDLACDICDLKFTSWVIANDHLNGKRHAKRLRMAQQAKTNAPTPVAAVKKPVETPVAAEPKPDIQDSTAVPSRTLYRTERMSSFKARTVLVWPITHEDLSNPKLFDVVENCNHWFCRFYNRDRVDNKALGNLEIRFNTVADAEAGAKKLSVLRDGLKMEEGTPSPQVVIQKMKGNDTVDKSILAMKGSYPKGSFEYRTVFVGSLPPTVTEEKLQGYFPTSTSVLLPRDENNVHKGYAYIEYDTTEQATAVTNNVSSLVIDDKTVSVVNFFVANEKARTKSAGVKRPASRIMEGGHWRSVNLATGTAQPAAKKPAIAVEKQAPLPAERYRASQS